MNHKDFKPEAGNTKEYNRGGETQAAIDIALCLWVTSLPQ